MYLPVILLWESMEQVEQELEMLGVLDPLSLGFIWESILIVSSCRNLEENKRYQYVNYKTKRSVSTPITVHRDTHNKQSINLRKSVKRKLLLKLHRIYIYSNYTYSYNNNEMRIMWLTTHHSTALDSRRSCSCSFSSSDAHSLTHCVWCEGRGVCGCEGGGVGGCWPRMVIADSTLAVLLTSLGSAVCNEII